MAHKDRNFGLDVLRVLAIGGVLLTHMLGPIVPGILGVELFFVLSGYLIGSILLRMATAAEPLGGSGLRQFWLRRWFRTLPNYYLFLVVYFFAGPALSPGWMGTAARPWRYVFLIQNLAWQGEPFFGISWSLATEEWFYLLFPAAFWLFTRGQTGVSGILRRFFVVTAFFALIPPVLRLVYVWQAPDTDIRSIALLRLDAPMYGILLAAVHTRRADCWQRLRNWWPAGIAGTAMAWGLLLSPSPMVRSFAFCVSAPAFALMLPAATGWSVRGGAIRTAIQRLSVWSYSLYLSHMFLYDAIRPALRYDEMVVWGRLAVKVLILIVCILFSALNYRFFERPLTNLRERFAPELR